MSSIALALLMALNTYDCATNWPSSFQQEIRLRKDARGLTPSSPSLPKKQKALLASIFSRLESTGFKTSQCHSCTSNPILVRLPTKYIKIRNRGWNREKGEGDLSLRTMPRTLLTLREIILFPQYLSEWKPAVARRSTTAMLSPMVVR
ncbi:hypothetical protein Landi51_02733 [Colletotrichum acutatum]